MFAISFIAVFHFKLRRFIAWRMEMTTTIGKQRCFKTLTLVIFINDLENRETMNPGNMNP